ncbi:hypothetical protein C0Q16_29770, partial [Klebsiella pneumoniae]
ALALADAQGVWRYPVTIADVSPRYLQALIQYEDAALALADAQGVWRYPVTIADVSPRYLQALIQYED